MISSLGDNKIPNSYLYQPESESRQWMLKRGKNQMVYYDNQQIKQIKKYFETMGPDEDGMIGIS